MEDKGKYFGVDFEALNEFILGATVDDKKIYSVDSDGLTLFYALITALKENKVV
jgi:hypothetical protein